MSTLPDPLDQLDRSLARVRAAVALQSAALEGAPGAIPDGAHCHATAIIEDLLGEAARAVGALRDRAQME
jgi:hypothetical protein